MDTVDTLLLYVWWYVYLKKGAYSVLISECICIHLKSDVEKFYLLCLMTRKLFTFAKQECMEENPDSIVCQEVLTPGQLYLMFLKARIFSIFLSFFCLCPFSFAEQDCSSISAAPLGRSFASISPDS